MTNYADIAQMAWEQLPEPKLAPVGTWLLRTQNATFIPKKDGSEQDAKVLFFYSPKEPMDDVRADELDASYDYTENDIVKMFYVRKPKDWDAVKKHLALHGVEPTGSIPETLKQVKGSEVLSYINHKTYVNNAGQTVTQEDPTAFAAVQ